MLRKIVGVDWSMNDEETIIDLKFGLSQLSGNRDLLIKLLVKFQTQYADLADKLDILFAEGDMATAKGSIHTVKGVTGNLGLRALHIAAKSLETAVSEESNWRYGLSEFNSVLTKTLDEITALVHKTNPIEPMAQNDLNLLKDLLQRNEYISPSKLVDYLDQSGFTESRVNQISQAIEELDYPKALTILESN